MTRLLLRLVLDLDLSTDRSLGLVQLFLKVDRVVAVLGNKRDQCFERSVTGVVDKLSSAGSLELYCGETGDLEGSAGRVVVLGGVHLGTFQESATGRHPIRK